MGDLNEAQKDKNGMYSLISGYICNVKDNHANRPKEASNKERSKDTHRYLWKGKIEEIS